MRSYPSTVKEIRFLTTIQKGFRFPPQLVFLGTLVYWIFGWCFTRPPKYLSKIKLSSIEPAIDSSNTTAGIEYSDCYLHDNDARFVFSFIRKSMDNGCVAANYIESLGAKKENGLWLVEVRDNTSGAKFSIKTKVLINACGPYVDKHNEYTRQGTEHSHLFSKGIHLIVDKVTEHNHILAFFASDARLFFVIPMGSKSCIGTTDTQISDPDTDINDDDREFILKNANTLLSLESPLTKEDIISERCGVRPLAQKGKSGIADWMKLSRKHAIDVNKQDKHLSIFGGKLTDCINVGEEVARYVNQLDVALSHPDKRWYGEASDDIKQKFLHQAQLMNLDKMTSPHASEALSLRLWRRYGEHALNMLESIRSNPDQGEILIEHTEYLRCELEYIAEREMVTKLEDFLTRRSKISFVIRQDDVLSAKGLKEACDILFAETADIRLAEYKKSLAAR